MTYWIPETRLERIAEELMGRRKWKLYQDSMHRNYLQPLNNNIKKNEKYQKDLPEVKGDEQQPPHKQPKQDQDTLITANDTKPTIKDETSEETPKDEGRTSAEPPEDVADDDDKLKDWSPQSKCYFCVDGKLDEHNNHGGLSPRHTDSDSSDSPSDLEAPPTLTPTASLLNNLSKHRNMTALESVTSMAALATVAALSGNAPGPTAPHLPYYPPNLLQPNWFQLANLARNFQADRVAEPEKAVVGGEQPLDLSSKGGNNNGASAAAAADTKINTNMRLPTLDKHIFNSDFRAKPRMSAVAGRRTYTEDELQAALRDIQSGKLGTRRAAVIYGIPRSTLRNKIDEDEAMDDDKDLSGAEEEKEVEKALERPLLSMADILRFSNLENTETIKALLQKSKESGGGGGGGGGDGLGGGVEQSALGQIHNFIMNGLLSAQKGGNEGGDGGNFSDYVKRIVAEDILGGEKGVQNNGDSEKLLRPSPSNSVVMKSKSESDMETEDSTSNVILKIPSYKPTSSKNGDTYNRGAVEGGGSLVSPPINSESPPILPGKGMTLKDVKDVIAKSISQKFQQSPEPLRHPMMEMDFKRVGYTTPPLSGMSVIKTQPELRQYQPGPQVQPQVHQQQKQQQQQQQNSSSGTSGGKGTRPKRGKYRNYDRDSLVEAVRAVQRGEMSVHRAGSYYGVPHSTLEYKVKERHLMRPRKRDPKPNPVDEKIASLKQNDIRNAADKLKSQVIKPPQKFPPTSPNGMKLPMYDANMPIGFSAPPFPFWPHPGFHHIPIDYGRSSTSAGFPANPEQFFASQMMQKLHEESSRVPVNAAAPTPPALAKNARQMAESLLDTTGSNGFLDGIIRSSLESGVPSSDDKKEDKNVAPENMSNKALLDQLCRNSCLTPLTKPNMTESSSGDEESLRKGSAENSMETMEPSDIHTIELSNDSNDSSKPPPAEREEKDRGDPTSTAVAAAATPRIYLKQELTKPENLKPEMLVRYRDVLHDVDRNGITEGSASESDAAQD